MAVVTDMVLFALLAAVALAVVRARNLFSAAMLAGVFSLLAFSLFVTLDAVDVAFTEAAVGAGLSTALILAAMARVGRVEAPSRRRALVPLLAVAATGALLVYGTLDLPPVGDPGAPVHGELTERYLAGAKDDVGVPNVVTAVLASYRGYDTLGEVVVVFTAAVAVWLLLGALRRQEGEA